MKPMLRDTNYDEAASETRQTEGRASRDSPDAVSKRVFGGLFYVDLDLLTQQTNHITSTTLEPQTLPVGPVLLHEPLDVVLRQR